MNGIKLVVSILGAATLGGLVASPALAGSCVTRIRNFPTSGSDSITISCKRNSAAVTTGVVTASISGATKTITANLTTGRSVSIRGLTSTGDLVAGCSIKDDNANGTAVSGNCNAAVKWAASASHVE